MIRRMTAALISTAMALALWSGSAAAFDPTSMTDTERAAFRAEIRAYLLENPEIIIEAVNVLEERKATAQAQSDVHLIDMYADDLFDDGYSWIGGNPDGDVTIVEFMDYRCGFCRRAVPEIAKLLSSDGNIRIIVKEFPILGEASMISSRFAIATQKIAGPDAYKQVHDALIELTTDPTDVVLRRLAEGLALDADAIMAHMDSDEVTEVIARNRHLGQQLQINGTPSFVFESQLMRGYLTADQMAQAVARERG